MLAYEAFLRRAAALNMPFMLKGSYVTRQYYTHPGERIPADLDWVCLEPLQDVEVAETLFDNWAIAVTESEADDGVVYTSFTENRFWRLIDYAMDDDFPTVNTDLSCTVDGEQLQYLNLDISFNLDIDAPPVPMLYTPLRGEPFVLPFTAPLSLQVSWKIHQTLVRLRFKDLLDLIHLLQHPSWNRETLQQSLQALVNECAADKVDIRRLGALFSGNVASLCPPGSLQKTWEHWRHEGYSDSRAPLLSADHASLITDAGALPVTLPEFLSQLTKAFAQAGWNETLLQHLPPAQLRRGKTRTNTDIDEQQQTKEEPYPYTHPETYYIEPEEEPSPVSRRSERSRVFWRFWYRLFNK